MQGTPDGATGPLRALTVIPSIARRNGGPGLNLVRSIPDVARAGVHVTVVTTDMASPAAFSGFRRLSSEDLPPGADAITLRVARSRPPHRLNFAPGLHAILHRELRDKDVLRIQGMYLYPHLAAFLAARARKVPYFVSPHGILDPYIRARSVRSKELTDRLWQERMVSGAQFLHATTELEAEHIRQRFPAARVVVVPNGLDLGRFAEPEGGAEFRAQRLAGWTGPVIACIGRVSHKKGLDTLIRSVAHLPRSLEAKLVLVGPDDEELTPELQALADSLGIGASVVFTGPLYGEEQLGVLDAADVWALPSRGENFGNAVVEAMAACLPVIVSPLVALAPAMLEADAGVVVDAEPEAFAQAISSVLNDPASALDLGARGRAFVKRYDWSSVAPQMADMYRTAARK